MLGSVFKAGSTVLGFRYRDDLGRQTARSKMVVPETRTSFLGP